METMNSLLVQNSEFNRKYGLLSQDLEMVNEMIVVIQSTRSSREPKLGDRIICTGPNKVYKEGHLELPYTEKFSSICTRPYIPFTSIHRNDDGTIDPWFNSSGGYWLNCTDRSKYKYIGTCTKTFQAFGHCGPCGGGAVHFQAEVNVWELFLESIY